MDFKINPDTTIKSEDCVKLLGVHIDNKLSFDEHVSILCKKASCQINVLKRFVRILDQNVKLLLYKSFISCHFNYCPAVWHACGATNSQKLEKLQYRALKFVFNDYNSSYESLLTKAGMPSLEVSRLRNIASEVYKAYNKLSPSYICDMFNKNVPNHTYNHRRKIKLCILYLVSSCILWICHGHHKSQYP